jgi:hypothetical protein
MPAARVSPVPGELDAVIDGEMLTIPSRIYEDEIRADARARMSPLQRLIAACLFSRHHDGRVREAAATQIAAANETWVAPYVVLLMGDYVEPVLVALLRALDEGPRDGPGPSNRLGPFVRANPDPVDRTLQRIESYWDAHHQAVSRDTYAGFALASVLRAARVG